MHTVWLDATTRPLLMRHTPSPSSGPAAAALIVYDNRRLVRYENHYVGVVDNNVAEYHALLHALRYLLAHEVRAATIYTDSQTLAHQLNYQARCVAPLLVSHHLEARRLSQWVDDLRLRWVPRERNREADLLADMFFTDPLCTGRELYQRVRRELREKTMS